MTPWKAKCAGGCRSRDTVRVSPSSGPDRVECERARYAPRVWRRRPISHSAAPSSSEAPPKIAGPELLPVNGSDVPAIVVGVVAAADTEDGLVVDDDAPSVTTVELGTVVFTTEVGDTVIVVDVDSSVVVVAAAVVVVVGSSVVVVVAATVVVVVGSSVVVVAATVVVVVGATLVVVVVGFVVVVVDCWHCDWRLTDVVFVAFTPSEGHRAATVSVTVPVCEPGIVVVALVEPDGPTLVEYPVTA
jgi:hypothetical protein